MKIKKLIFLAVTILIFGAVSLFSSSIQFNIMQGSNVSLYDDQYKKIDAVTPIDKNGYIIQTEDEQVVLSSDFAELYIAPNSIFSITDFSTTNPTCYLIQGKVNIFILYPQNVTINCYTPTSNFMISTVGEYILTSTDDEETFYNFSTDTTKVYDSIRERDFEVSSYTYAKLFTAETNLPIDKETYKNLSIFGNEIEEEIPEPVSNITVSVVPYKPAVPASPTSLTVDTAKLPSVPTISKTIVSPFVEKLPQVPTLTVSVTKNISVPSYPNFTRVTVKETPTTKTIPINTPNVVVLYPEVLDGTKTTTKESTPVKNEEVVQDVPVVDTNVTETKKVNVISEKKVSRNPFSLYLTSSLSLDNKDGIVPVLALQPNIDTGTFKANFNIDILNLLSFNEIDKNWRAYYNFAASFINQISYNTINEKFGISLSRFDSTIEYDPLGIFSLEDRGYEIVNSKLALTHYLKSDYFNQSLTIDDVSLNTDVIKANYTSSLTFSKAWKFGIILGLNAITSVENWDQTALFPFAKVSIPLFENDSFSIKTEIGGATLYQIGNKFDINNSFVEVALPMDFYGANITLGGSYNFAAYSKGAIVYDEMISNTAPFKLNLKSSFENKLFTYRLNLLFPIDTDTVQFISGAEFFDFAFGFKMSNYKLELGFKTFGLFSDFLTSVKEVGDFYTTLSYSDSNFETGLSVIRSKGVYNLKIFNTIKSFSYINNDIVDSIDNRIFNFGIDVAYQSQIFDFGTISLIPFIEVGNEDYNLALQFPIAVKLDDKIFTFENYDNLVYNFGIGKTNSVERTFDIINDTTSFIKKLTLGNTNTAFYLYMDRNYAFDVTSNLVDFKKYSFKDQLTTILGTRFGSYGNLDLIVPNIAKPNLIASNIRILPTGQIGDYDIEVNFPVEFLIQNDSRYSISAFPFIRANLYFKNFGMNLLFTTMLNLNNNMDNSIVFNQYLFGENQRYTIGGGINFRIGSSKFIINGGAFKGRNDSAYFNPFYEMLGYSTMYEARTSNFSFYDKMFKFYAEVGYSFTKDAHKLKLSYRIDDVLSYMNKDFASDILNFDYSYNVNENTNFAIGFYLSALKKQFIDLDFNNYMRSNKILSYFNLNKTFNHYQIGIQLNIAPQVDKNDTTYVNSFSTLDNAVISVSTYATFRY